jgi:aromatase
MSAHVDKSIVIDAPMDVVWDRTNDIESWPSLFSEYSAAEIIERDGNTVTFRLTMHPDEAGRVWSWVSARTLDAATHTTRSHRVETGPFKYMSIFWEYTQEPGGVRMRWVQDFEMKPQAPLDDAAMAARIEGNMDVQLPRIKGIVERAAAGV